ncbi:MAG TPA: rod shape-determining protein MreC [Actinomycetota bacterium]|nr:rod shape-determining protein MreC [Actinomycetota bacterium]
MALSGRTRNARLLVIVLVSASLATITVDYRQGESGPLAGVGRAALEVMAPLQAAVSRVTRPVGDVLSTLVRLPEVRSENERLRAELARARAQLAQQASLEARYEELVRLLDLQEALDPPTVTAVVIGSGVSNFEWTITVDKGTDDGVGVGSPVLASAGLVGRVVKASATSSLVELIIDPDAQVAARLATSRQTGLLQGQGEDDLRMRGVDPATPVEAGEPVETAGYQGGLYPPGIPIGVVSRVVENPAALEKLVLVRPAVDFSTLEFVLVVKQPAEG